MLEPATGVDVVNVAEHHRPANRRMADYHGMHVRDDRLSLLVYAMAGPLGQRLHLVAFLRRAVCEAVLEGLSVVVGDIGMDQADQPRRRIDLNGQRQISELLGDGLLLI